MGWMLQGLGYPMETRTPYDLRRALAPRKTQESGKAIRQMSQSYPSPTALPGLCQPIYALGRVSLPFSFTKLQL